MSIKLSNQSSDFLRAWHSKRPTFALMGEFSAGKSTLLNLILERNLLPTQVTATNVPVVWITTGKKERCHILGRDGSFDEFELPQLPKMKFDANQFLLRLEMPIKAVEKIDIIDTPGISDPRQKSGFLEFLYPYLDFAVWCTSANQAWRQTEAAMWNAIPSDIYENSILALTRADMVQRSSDLRKVVRRCKSETKGSFGSVIPIATVPAMTAKDKHGTITDQLTWAHSYAEGFFDDLQCSIVKAIAKCALREPLAVPAVVSNLDKALTRASAGNAAAAPRGRQLKKKTAKRLAACEEGPSAEIARLDTDADTPRRSKSNARNHQPANDLDRSSNSHTAENNLTKQSPSVLNQLLGTEQSTNVSIGLDLDPSQTEREDTEPLRMPIGKSWTKLTGIITGVQTTRKPNDDDAASITSTTMEENNMANTDISELAQIGGFIGACLVDSETGLMMASEGGGKLDLEAAGAANTEVVKAKLSAIEMLGLDDSIDDILITLGKQFHLIRPLSKSPTVFIYVALDKKTANLGMARVQVKKVESGISL